MNRGPTFRVFCTACGCTLSDGFQAFCPECEGMSDVEYDLARVVIHQSCNPFVRFRELMPIADSSLLPTNARFTPTIHAKRLGSEIGLPWLYMKNETCLPTGTTKDRMAAVALAYLHECGVRGFATSSTGNSSTAYAHAIHRLPNLVMYLFTASQFVDRVDAGDTEQVIHFVLRDATFVEAFEAARVYAEQHALVPERGFFNPARREGLKLAWLEAAEQVPRPIDCYVQAVSSAMGVYGVFKGAQQLHALGRTQRIPRLMCVQQETCAPMVAAWKEGSEQIEPRHIVRKPTGIAQAILRGNPSRAYPHVRRIVIESGGQFVAVSESEIRRARRLVEELEGLRPCFAAAAAVAGAARLRRSGTLHADEVVLVNLTGGDRPGPVRPLRAQRLIRSERGWMPADVGVL